MSLPDWKGLLKWSLRQSDPGDKGTQRLISDQKVRPMSKEDVAFLEGAMASLHEHEKELAHCVIQINRIAREFAQSHTSDGPALLEPGDKAVLLSSLEKVEEHFEEHPSNARSLIRQGLLESFTLLLGCDDHEVLSACLSVGPPHAQIISCSFSNNESILEEASESQLLPRLLSLRANLAGTEIEPRLITALSAVVRNCTTAENAFVRLGGLEYLRECLGSPRLRTRERAVLLLNHFVSLNRVSVQELRKLGPYSIVKALLPLDPAAHGRRGARAGIQFAELSCTLVTLLVKMHKFERVHSRTNLFTPDQVGEVGALLARELETLSSQNNPDYDTLRQIIEQSNE